MTIGWTGLRQSRPTGELWRLEGARAIPADRTIAGPTTLLVPSEELLLLPVDLPLPTARRRREALLFAIEDRLIDPLEAVHVALGAELAPRRYLAGVVRHEVMRRWIAAVEAAGIAHAAFLPDALALPRPREGSWSIMLAGDRALVRTDDGAGFAAPIGRAEALWRIAGQPAGTPFGEQGVPAFLAGEPVEAAPLDLRQGAYARRAATPGQPLIRRLAWIAGAGLAAHGAIAMADTLALRSIAADRKAQAEALIAIASPGRYLGAETDLEAIADELIPDAEVARPSRFLPLLARSSAALAPIGQAVALTSIEYHGDTLMIDIAGEPDALARAQEALRRAGFAVSANTIGERAISLSLRGSR